MTQSSARSFIDQPLITDAYQAEYRAWQADLDLSLTREDGWLSLAGLFWLQDGANTLGSDPHSDIALPVGTVPAQVGAVHFSAGVAHLHLTTDVPVLVNGQVVPKAEPFRLLDDSAGDSKSVVRINDVSFFVIKRGDLYGIRALDRNSPTRATFQGRVWFPLNADLISVGRFERYDAPKLRQLVTSAGIPDTAQNIGYVTFTIHGQALQLEAFADSKPDQLFFVFKDLTNAGQTYGAGRFLVATVADDARTVIDFNRAYNPPCAFTHFAACPRAIPENHLPIAIEAGELQQPHA